MKWLLVVYFFVAGEWVTADSIGMDGWGSIYYKTDEECLTRQHEFTDNMKNYSNAIRAQCEHIGFY